MSDTMETTTLSQSKKLRALGIDIPILPGSVDHSWVYCRDKKWKPSRYNVKDGWAIHASRSIKSYIINDLTKIKYCGKFLYDCIYKDEINKGYWIFWCQDFYLTYIKAKSYVIAICEVLIYLIENDSGTLFILDILGNKINLNKRMCYKT